MTPGVASVCQGTVRHRRAETAEHTFDYPMSMVWIDPDHPNDLCHHHRLYSPAEPAPARFRRGDYGDDRTPPLGLLVRDDLEPVLGHRPDGPIRMLTQLRRFGWLFNPITVYLAWDADDDEPVGAVLEVTNTPWHERHRYVVALHDPAPQGEGPRLIDTDDGFDSRGDGQATSMHEPARRTARFPKQLHVSPFFGQQYDYILGVGTGEAIRIDLQLIDTTGAGTTGSETPGTDRADVVALETSLRLHRTPASRRALGRHLWSAPLSTYRVSAGIHAQAARLAAKRVPFVRHPKTTPQESSHDRTR